MFLIMGMTLAFASAYVEIKLVHGSSTVDRLYTSGLVTPFGHIKGVWFNTAGSFALSYLLGVMFAADGLTVLFGAMVSTGLSQMWFSGEKYCNEMGWSVKGFKDSSKKFFTYISNAHRSAVSTYRDFERPIKDIFHVIKMVLKALVWPISFTRKISAAYSTRRVA